MLWEWRAPNGRLKDLAARTLLLKLEPRGQVCLPAKRRPSPNRMLPKQLGAVTHAHEPIPCSLAQLTPRQGIELSQRPDPLRLYEWLLHEDHYLSYASAGGRNLKYLGRDRPDRLLSGLLFGSAAWKGAVRDQFIGGSPATRQARPQPVTNPTRFLLLPWVQGPHLASQVLSQVLRRLPGDWQRK